MRGSLHSCIGASALLATCSGPSNSSGHEAPVRPTSWADSIASVMHMRSDTGGASGLSFHWEATPWLDARIDDLRAQATASLRHDLELLDRSALHQPVDILYFDAREDLRPLTGFTPKGIALLSRNALLIATNDSIRAYHTHELMHILSVQEWGRAADPADWIQEGLSMYADESCLGHEMFAIAAYQLHQGRLYPLDSLTQQFRKLEDVKSYTEAGAFAHYLIDRFGMRAFEEIWRNGWDAFPKITGETPESGEAAYRAFLLERFPTPPTIDWPTMRDMGCG